MTVQDTFAATLVDEWARAGVSDAVVAPGSRSTPLATALAADGRVRLHVIVDERSAGFFALGLGLATGRPAVVLTTSGTAAVELSPAVVEAHHARVPLLACTADRPPELHGVGAPQTIEQDRLFEGVLRARLNPGVADAASTSAWRSLASRAVAEARAGPLGPGPVQLNLVFRDPLVGTPGELPAGRAGGRPWHQRVAATAVPPAALVAELAGHGGRGLIVAGAGAGDPASVHALAGALGWPVLADPRSGCRVPGANTVAAADALLRVGAFAAGARPEVVLRLGAPWASRVVGEWLGSGCPDAAQYLVDPHGAWLDPARTAATVVAADPTALVVAVASAAGLRPAPPSWAQRWQEAEAAAQAAIDAELAAMGDAGEPLSEPAVARALVDALPHGADLVVSSSMPVRDVEWYGRPRGGLRVLANRGANGIDGVVSTAMGVAASGTAPTTALVGDLAFVHDATGLLAGRPAAGVATPCTVVVVDNDGGGIFSFLPQASALPPERFERLLGTPHGLDLVTVARALGAEAEEATTLKELLAAVEPGPAGRAAGAVRVVVVRSDRRANVEVHDRLHGAVATTVGRP